MNQKRIFTIAMVLAAAILAPTAAPLMGDDTGESCIPRALTQAEQQWYMSTMKAVKNAFTRAPSGWKVTQTSEIAPYQGTTCTAPLFPIGITFHVEFAHMGRIMKHAEEFNRDNKADRLESLNDRLTAALAKGDMKTVQRIQKEMQDLHAGGAEGMVATVEARINQGSVIEAMENPRPYAVKGADFGLIQKDDAGQKIVIYMGRWKRHEGGEILSEFREGTPNAAVQIIEIVVRGDIAPELIRMANLGSLRSLCK